MTRRVLKELEITAIAAVDAPCQEGAVMTIMKRREEPDLEKIIRQDGDKWCLYSHDGKKLGEFDSKAEAEKREREIKYFANKRAELSNEVRKMSLRADILNINRQAAELLKAGDWDESKHPRGEGGKFSSEGGGSSTESYGD